MSWVTLVRIKMIEEQIDISNHNLKVGSLKLDVIKSLRMILPIWFFLIFLTLIYSQLLTSNLAILAGLVNDEGPSSISYKTLMI